MISQPLASAANGSRPDFEHAAAFLDRLAGDTPLTFQTFPDCRAAAAEGRKRGLLTRVLHGSFTDWAATLGALNLCGAGIFVMVNEGDGTPKGNYRTCRTNANVVRVRALFLDLDGAPVEPALNGAVPPSMVVESSPNKYHVYWLVRDMPLSEFKTCQQALAHQYGGDLAVCDLARVLRVPGFYHCKKAPFMSRWVEVRS